MQRNQPKENEENLRRKINYSNLPAAKNDGSGFAFRLSWQRCGCVCVYVCAEQSTFLYTSSPTSPHTHAHTLLILQSYRQCQEQERRHFPETLWGIFQPLTSTLGGRLFRVTYSLHRTKAKTMRRKRAIKPGTMNCRQDLATETQI